MIEISVEDGARALRLKDLRNSKIWKVSRLYSGQMTRGSLGFVRMLGIAMRRAPAHSSQDCRSVGVN